MIHLIVYMLASLYHRIKAPDDTFEARSYGGV